MPHPRAKKQAAAPPVRSWQDAAVPWTEPRPVLPTWSTVGRWLCLGAFLVGMQLGGPAAPAGFAFLFLALGVEAIGARSAPKAPYPRMRRPLLAAGSLLVGGLLAAGLWADLFFLIPIGIALAIAYRIAMTRATRESFPDAVAEP